jgi:hypothetical protein
MRYVPPRLEAPRIQRERIPTGLAGTKRTAAHVARLIREGAGDFYVRQKAIDILLQRGVPAKDYVGEIDALFRWVQRNVRYTKDPFRIEALHAPRRMLELRAGDCDDMTILLGALVKSIGHPVRLVLTGPNARRPDLFSHIYLEAQHRGDWIPLDATMPFGMGWSPRAPVRLVRSIEEEATHDEPASRPASPAGSPDGRATRAGARMAPRPAARDTNGRSPAARPASESAVDPAAAPAAARAQRVGPDHSASHLAAGSRPAASPAHHRPHPGAARDGGSAGRAAAAASREGRGAGDGRRAAAPPSPTGDAAARGDGAAAAGAAPNSPAGTARTTLNGAIEDASALYRRFTQLPARSLRRVSHPRLMPPVVVELGRLMALVYRSTKWVGHPRTYIHYMEDPPSLVSDVDGRRLFVIGGSYRITARGIEG